MVLPENKQFSSKHSGIVRAIAHKTISSIVNSANHQWRENDIKDYPHIDLSQTYKNIDLIGATNSAELIELLEKKLANAKYISSNSVRCIEFLVTADFDAFSENGGPLITDDLVKKTRQLLKETFGIENIIAFNVQLDELTPHIVAYVVPIIEKPARTICKLKTAGTYCDGSTRYIKNFKTIQGYTSLSATYFYDQFGGKSGLQTLFSEFVFKPNGLRRGFYFSKLRHINAREHKLSLRMGYSAAMANLEFTPEKIKSLNLRIKSNEKICSTLNKIVLENAKAIIAMSAEYQNEKGKRLSLEKTLVITQEKMLQLESKNKALSFQLDGYNTLSSDNQITVNDYIETLNQKEKEIAQKIIDSKEKERNEELDKIKKINLENFILLDDHSRFKIWRFALENPELEEKFEELFSTDFFNPEDGSLNEKGFGFKKSLNKENSEMSQKNNEEPTTDCSEFEPTNNISKYDDFVR